MTEFSRFSQSNLTLKTWFYPFPLPVYLPRYPRKNQTETKKQWLIWHNVFYLYWSMHWSYHKRYFFISKYRRILNYFKINFALKLIRLTKPTQTKSLRYSAFFIFLLNLSILFTFLQQCSLRSPHLKKYSNISSTAILQHLIVYFSL